MDIYAGIDAMRDGIRRRAWREVETTAGTYCRELDAKAADAIAALDLAPYRDQIASVLETVLATARAQGSAAVYWEFDLDNGWDSAFFLCGDYAPEVDEDDEWASDFDEAGVVRGPSQSDLARLYGSHGTARQPTLPVISSSLAALLRHSVKRPSGSGRPPSRFAPATTIRILCSGSLSRTDRGRAGEVVIAAHVREMATRSTGCCVSGGRSRKVGPLLPPALAGWAAIKP